MNFAGGAVEDQIAHPISVVPHAGQTIKHNGQHYITIKEGLAYILVPLGTPTSTDPKLSGEETQRQQVFYNPIQQFNRDLSVLTIKTFGQDIIQRKTMKHEQQRAKVEKKKQRVKERRAAEEASKSSESTDAGDELSKKRKLEEDECGGQLNPSKKQKMVEDPADQTGDELSKKHENGEKESEEQVETLQKQVETLQKQVETLQKQKACESHTVEMGETREGAKDASPDPDGQSTSWQPQFSILDALSATGLRALRYAREIPFATSITANDMLPKAVESIKLNIKHNKLESKIKANTGNAIAFMYSFCGKKGFDVIDLDPYGTASPFIDSAIQAISDEGLLCVTCTDSAIFASHGYLEKTYSQYGGLPLKGDPCHEGGLRLILHAIATSAARYGMAIEPLLSLSVDYYIRVFVRIRKSPSDVKLLAGKTMMIYHCENGCNAWSTQFLARNRATKNKRDEDCYRHGFAQAPSADRHCQYCGFKTHLSGPMYGGPLHNVDFVERVLAQLGEADRESYPTMDRIEGMLHTAMEEVTLGVKRSKGKGMSKTQILDPLIPKADPAAIDHHPFFFLPSSVAKVIHCSAPSLAALRGALRHAGFKVTMSHCKPGSIKTNASWKDVWHVMLEWVRQRAPLHRALKKETPGYAIMAKARASHHNIVSEPSLVVKSDGVDGEPAAPTAASAPTPQLTTVESYHDINYEVKFDEEFGKDPDRGKYVRYQLAPRENWGPMSRAK